jgi:hypothetical protein
LRLLCLLVAIACSLALMDFVVRLVFLGETEFRIVYGIGDGFSLSGRALHVAAIGLGAYVLSRALKALQPEDRSVAHERLTPR